MSALRNAKNKQRAKNQATNIGPVVAVDVNFEVMRAERRVANRHAKQLQQLSERKKNKSVTKKYAHKNTK